MSNARWTYGSPRSRQRRQPVAQPGSPDTLAVAAADQAAASGLDKLAKGPSETFHRVGVTPGGAGLFFAAYERIHAGLRVVGGDAVVVADGKGAVRETVAAPTNAITVGTTAGLVPSRAADIAAKQMSTVDSVTGRSSWYWPARRRG
jgi:Zn-dependent metalloprotease